MVAVVVNLQYLQALSGLDLKCGVAAVMDLAVAAASNLMHLAVLAHMLEKL
jgi:hypothetical protein